MPRFNSANAKEMAAKSHAARLQRRTSGNLAGETFPQTPQVGQEEAANDYVARRLARVRKQLDSVDAAIEECIGGDSKRLKELTDAQMRLAEQERQLAGRPLPGSRRPSADHEPRRTQRAEPQYPQPVVLPAPAAPAPPSQGAG